MTTVSVSVRNVPPIERGKGRNWNTFIKPLKIGEHVLFESGTRKDVDLIRQACKHVRRSIGQRYAVRQFNTEVLGIDVMVRRVA